MCFALILFAFNALCTNLVSASLGDRSPFYHKCVRDCSVTNCTDGGAHFQQNYEQPVFEKLLLWSCEDDCKYHCMWSTVEAFLKRDWGVPQFYGKWPFVRFLGMQEPASVLFSVLNLYVHIVWFKKFRLKIHWSTPFFWMWNLFSIISMNGWFWSTVFHSRDTPFTEFMDYSCAFSIVYIMFYCMTMRVMSNWPKPALVLITTVLLAFFANHVAYLHMGRFSYSYNMQLNILIGTITALCWFGWCSWNRLRQPYVWKCAVYVALTGLSLLLEVIDRPPFLWIVDSHALWHLSSVPLTMLFYSFILDDSRYMRKQVSTWDNEKFTKQS